MKLDLLSPREDLVFVKALLATFAVGAVALLVYKAFFRGNERAMAAVTTTCDLNNQSVILPGDERIRACAMDPSLPATCDDDIKTVYDMFNYAYNTFGDNPFLGSRASETAPYTWVTYKEVEEKAHAVGSGLINLGVPPKALIGMCAANQTNWTIVEHGFAMFSMVSVPLYETLGKEGIAHIMGHTEMQMIVCDARKIDNLLDHGGSLGHLKWIVVLDEPTEDSVAKAKEASITLIKLNDLIESGKGNLQAKVAPAPQDTSCICYTSGTTGNPKGVVLSHYCQIASISASKAGMEYSGVAVSSDDTVISFLPLSHAYERVVELLMTWCGGRIGYFRGDVTKLLSDIQELKPTIFPAVPRLLNSLYDRIMLTVSDSRIKSFLLRRGLAAKEELLKRGCYRRDTLWDTLVFRKIQNVLGGNVRIALTGSAPLSAAVVMFVKCALGCPVVEGYGQTESAGAASVTNAYDTTSGHVGCPLTCFHIKVVDVPELGYSAKDDCGEICLRGPAMFTEYYKDPEKTKETLDEDGWLHTGDVGKWLPTGVLQIVDRKKHFFKLSQGEYVAPENVELVYMKSPYVTHVFVTGDSLKNYVVGIVAPDELVLQQWAKKNNIKGTFEQLCKMEEVKAIIFDSMMQVAKANNVCSFEQAKIIHLDHQQFSIENDLLTPTLKKRRPQIKAKYKDIIQDMYAKQEARPQKISVF